ncbi:DUF6476 family protein [Kangsaoukella pontilimi]|nr:DUF6476 family protein [Kangsaoukella pontilimi]
MSDMDDDDGTRPDDRNLVFLRRLVTVLTATMIFGVLTIVVLLVIRLQTPPSPSLPDGLTLPEGVTAEAVTFGRGWIAVVTGDGRILILDRTTGAVLQDVPVSLPR